MLMEQANAYEFLLTRLLRGVTRALYHLQGFSFISTHTPLARRALVI